MHFGLAEWEGQGCYVVKIKQYVKIEAPHNSSPHSTTHAGPMRFAICDLYQQTLVDNALGECHIVPLQEPTHPAYTSYAVNIEGLMCKVVWGGVANISFAKSKAGKEGPGHGFPDKAWYFVCHPNSRSHTQVAADASEDDIVDDVSNESQGAIAGLSLDSSSVKDDSCVLTLIHVNECPSYNICGSRIQCSSQMKFTKALQSIKACSSFSFCCCPHCMVFLLCRDVGIRVFL